MSMDNLHVDITSEGLEALGLALPECCACRRYAEAADAIERLELERDTQRDITDREIERAEKAERERDEARELLKTYAVWLEDRVALAPPAPAEAAPTITYTQAPGEPKEWTASAEAAPADEQEELDEILRKATARLGWGTPAPAEAGPDAVTPDVEQMLKYSRKQGAQRRYKILAKHANETLSAATPAAPSSGPSQEGASGSAADLPWRVEWTDHVGGGTFSAGSITPATQADAPALVELVERLRAEDVRPRCGDADWCTKHPECCACRRYAEAADALERMERERGEARRIILRWLQVSNLADREGATVADWDKLRQESHAFAHVRKAAP